MQAGPIKFLQFLGENKVIFKVPVYQRNYEWRREQVEQYFSDIEKIAENNYEQTHFLGTIVFVSKTIENLMTERVLIDGQQRITTTILLLKAIVDLIEEESLETTIYTEEVNGTYLINPYASDQSRLRLKPVEADMDAYNRLMNNHESDSRIYDNYMLLKQLIKKSEYTLEEIYKAMQYIDIVYISLDQNENPQVIFESLNSTGLTLTQADLIRNFILMGLEYKEQTKLYKKYWTEIESLLPNKVISDFVRDFLTMKEGKVPNQNKVYESFKNYYFVNKYNSESILKELLNYALYYDSILRSSTGFNDIDEQLRNINNVRSTVTYPYLLDVFDDYYRTKIISQDIFNEILEIIVSYIYRRNISGHPTNALNKIFSAMPAETESRREQGMGYLEAVVDYLMSRSGSGIFPRNEEFKQNFIHTNMYSKSRQIAKLTLYQIEKSQHKEVVSLDNLSVEHILPQTLNSVWGIELGDNAYEIHQLYKDTIGNLAMTNYNSEMSNRSFDQKKHFITIPI